MNKKALSFTGCTALLFAATLNAATVTVDMNSRYQKIEGWGSCVGGVYYWDPYYKDYWQTAFRDLGCNILRLPMGKEVLVAPDGNYATPVELVDDLQTNIDEMNFSGMQHFAELALWLMDNAYEPQEVRIVGSVWSPPHWMKGPTGSSQYFVGDPTKTPYPTPWLTGCGGTCGSSVGGRLTQTPDNLEQFGRYITAWLIGFEQYYAITIYSVSLQNELAFENPFDSCTYYSGPASESAQYWQYANALKAVKDEFQQKGIDIKVHGPHHASLGDNPSNTWSLNRQNYFIQAVKDHSDPNLINFLDFYGSNGYQPNNEGGIKCWAGYWLGKQNVPASWCAWAFVPGIYQDGIPVWFSECGGPKAPWLNGAGGTPGDGAICVAQKIHSALVHANTSSYVYWQFCDDSPDETQHTLLGMDDILDPLGSKKYCAYKHFSRYIRPGAQRIGAAFANAKTATGGNSEYDTYNSLNVSAFFHDSNGTLTIVLVNMKASAQSVTINVPADINFLPFSVYRTKDDENFAPLNDANAVDHQVTVDAPAYSVVTLVSTDIAALPADPPTNPWPHTDVLGVSTNTKFSWSEAFNATSFDVHFSKTAPPAFRQNQTDTSFDPGTLDKNSFYYWRVDARNDYDIITQGPLWRFMTGTDEGTGLTGRYFDNADLTNPKLTRLDPIVDFDWASGSPDPSIDPNTFSVRWTGLLQPGYSQTYTFYTNTDDGVRLWIDANLLIDKWLDQPLTEYSGTIALTANAKYDIAMEYYDSDANAVAQLKWSSPSQAKEIIPQGRLFRVFDLGDLNQDYNIDSLDAGIFADQWLNIGDCSADPNCADLDDTNNVDFEDFALLGENYGL